MAMWVAVQWLLFFLIFINLTEWHTNVLISITWSFNYTPIEWSPVYICVTLHRAAIQMWYVTGPGNWKTLLQLGISMERPHIEYALAVWCTMNQGEAPVSVATYPHLNILGVRLDWFCCTKTSFSSLGWAWACPTLIMTMALMHEIIIYLSIYHLPRICRSLVPEIRVRPKMHLVFSEYWCAYMHDLQWLNSKDDWSYSHLPWRLSMKTGGRMHRHMV